MSILILGLVIFLGLHLIPSMVGIRRNIITRLGNGTYLALFSAIAVLGLILIVYGKSQAEYLVIWQPPLWSRYLTILVMFFSFLLLTAGDIKSNIKHYIRHPMLVGILLWSGSHLLVNGDLASMVLFGSFFVFSIFDMISANIRGATVQQKNYPFYKIIIIALVSIVAYFVVIKYLHYYLIGIAII